MAHVEAIPQVLVFFAQIPGVAQVFGSRIWSEKVPDNPAGGSQPYPYARVNEVPGSSLYTHEGPSGRVINLQIDVWDDDQARADSSTELLRVALDAYQGMAGALTIGRSTARILKREWSSESRNYWRVIAAEVKTND